LSPITKRTSLRNFCLHVSAGLLVLLSNTGCNTRIQGCLDVNADNFNLNAEQSCNDCCTYPSVALSLTQKWGERNYANTDTLYDINGHAYRINSLEYFLSEWSWVDDKGIRYHVDSVNVSCDDGDLTYSPDNLLIDAEQFNYTMGEIRQAPSIDSLRFVFGLNQDFSCLDAAYTGTPPELTDQSPLWNSQSGSLESMRLIIQQDIAVESYDTIFISDKAISTLAYPFDFTPGEDSQFMLTVDYSIWFQDVNSANPASFRTSLISNFGGGISRTQ
jgi:hypothetical protein